MVVPDFPHLLYQVLIKKEAIRVSALIAPSARRGSAVAGSRGPLAVPQVSWSGGPGARDTDEPTRELGRVHARKF